LVESSSNKDHRPTAIVGQDSRASGEFLEAAVVAGLTSAGINVYRVGVLPTPAIAHLVAESKCDLGVMISASHNPMPDNGIKLFARGGGKLDDVIEARIEARMGEDWERPTGRNVGRAINDDTATERYLKHLLASVQTPLKGLKIVVDCANGASSFVAPEAYRRAGAEVVAIFNQPDGWNINDDCGSTHLHHLRAAVLKEGADANKPDDDGTSPISNAIQKPEALELVKILMQYGGVATAMNLRHAYQFNNWPVVLFLIKKGVPLSALNIYEKAAIQRYIRDRAKEISRFQLTAKNKGMHLHGEAKVAESLGGVNGSGGRTAGPRLPGTSDTLLEDQMRELKSLHNRLAGGSRKRRTRRVTRKRRSRK
jgi:hypothetical protein